MRVQKCMEVNEHQIPDFRLNLGGGLICEIDLSIDEYIRICVSTWRIYSAKYGTDIEDEQGMDRGVSVAGRGGPKSSFKFRFYLALHTIPAASPLLQSVHSNITSLSNDSQ